MGTETTPQYEEVSLPLDRGCFTTEPSVSDRYFEDAFGFDYRLDPIPPAVCEEAIIREDYKGYYRSIHMMQEASRSAHKNVHTSYSALLFLRLHNNIVVVIVLH